MRIIVPFGKSKLYTSIAYETHNSFNDNYELKSITQIIDNNPYVQNYVANMHQDMNAGFAMSAAISAKAFPAVKGWSMSMGAGFYEDKEAISFGVNYMSDKYGVTINLAQSQRGGTMANVGFSVSLNHLFDIKVSK